MVRRLRLKGTDIYVQAIEYRFHSNGTGGMYCKYLNGDRKGGYQIISGDCLVEENDPNIR